jgi:predicted DNA-binding protein with PD1-like motif
VLALEVVEDGNVVVVRLHDGEDFHPTMLAALDRVGLRHGVVLTGLGMLRDFELGWFEAATRQYHKRTFGTPHELVALSGSVAVTDDAEARTMPHLHAALAGPDHALVGGHLFKATTAVLNEVAVLRLNAPLRRRLNPATGLMELALPEG